MTEMKRILALTALMLAALVLFACRGEAPDGEETVPATEAETEFIAPFDIYPLPDISQSGGRYLQRYPAVRIDGATTTFQTGTSYTDALELPSDAMMAYVHSLKSLDGVMSSWKESGTDMDVCVMMPLNRDVNEFVSRNPDLNSDAIQMDSKGKYITHSTSSTTYYMVPTRAWADYVWEMVEATVNGYHPSVIVFEEPEMWHASGYSKGFREEWRDFYGNDWEDPLSSPEAMFRAMRLKVHLFERILTDISGRLEALSPDTRLYIATHSTLSYSRIGITAGLNAFMATGTIDGVIGQTWSDTADTPIPVGGSVRSIPFESSYLGYSSYTDSAEGCELFALSDPMSDNPTRNEAACYKLYRQTVTASLLNPKIHRFQLCPWPDRAFMAVGADYKTVQLSVYAALDAVAGKSAVLEAGTPGIAYLLSDSLSWQTGNDSWGPDSTSGFYGVTVPLVNDGIPLSVIAAECVTDAEDLASVKLLIVSYDIQKPVSQEINAAIAEWVKQGGVLLYLGGHDEYEKSEAEWWSESGSPLADLIGRLGLGLTLTSPVPAGSKTSMEWKGDGDMPAIDSVKLSRNTDRNLLGFEGAANPIVTAGEDVIGVNEAVGEGRFIALGIPSAKYGTSSSGDELVIELTRYAAGYTDYGYKSSPVMTVNRGGIVAAHAFNDEYELDGSYIDLLDTMLGVSDGYTVPADDSALLFDMSTLELSVPRLAFAGGRLVGEPDETAERTVFTLTAPSGSKLSARLAAPEGSYPVSVTATDENGEAHQLMRRWTNGDRTLLIQLDGSGQTKMTVTVEWGAEAVADDPEYELRSITVKTNAKNLDGDFLIENTAAANDSFRFCDLTGRVVYKFDLKKYPFATISLIVLQNYIVEYSTDNRTYKVIEDYSKINPEHLKGGGNDTVIQVEPNALGAADVIYIRIRNAYPSMGWGGSIRQFTVTYYEQKK